MRYALSIPNAAPPHVLVELAVTAERNGWDAVFLWDHVHFIRSMQLDLHDPWVVLGAIAQVTNRVRIGAMVTPLPRRRPQKWAKEVVTLDHLSQGRVVVGVGIGAPSEDEFGMFADAADERVRGRQLDEALTLVERLWTGEPVDHSGTYFHVSAQLRPRPFQQPRPPIWVAATSNRPLPLARAARYDGVFPMGAAGGLPGLDEIASVAAMMPPGVDVVASWLPDTDAAQYVEAGATWLVESRWPSGDWLDELADVASRPPTA